MWAASKSFLSGAAVLLSGVFYLVSNMPPWLQIVANLLPFTHAIAIGRPLLLGHWPDQTLLHLAVLAGLRCRRMRDRPQAFRALSDKLTPNAATRE